MFRTMVLIAFAALFTAPMVAQVAEPPKSDTTKKDENALKDGDVFKTADRNGDGKVTIQEVRDLRKDQLTDWRKIADADDPQKARTDYDAKYKDRLTLSTFLRYDTDDDEVLTAEEFESFGMGNAPEFTGTDAEVYGDMTFDEWTGFANTTGDELKISDYVTQMQKQRAASVARAGTNLELRYSTLRYTSRMQDLHDLLLADANDDGVVDRSEAREYWQKSYNGRFDGKLNDKDGKMFGDERVSERLSSLDANDDGMISREESNNAYDAIKDDRFKELDTNGDGQLSKDELRKWEMDDDIRQPTANRSSAPDRREDRDDSPEKDSGGKSGEMPEKK